MKIYIQVFLVLLLGLNGGLYGQDPRVVKIQIDACGAVDAPNEFFEFLTGNKSFNLDSNTLSINVFNASNSVVVSNFKAPSSSVLNFLNAKAKPCQNVFIDPFKPPYNGIIPPNSTVLAFTNNGVNVDALNSNQNALCGRSPIFVLVSTRTGPIAVFNNRLGCNFPTPRTIRTIFGNVIQEFEYDCNKAIDQRGYHILIDNNIVNYTTPDIGCVPISLPCDTPKITISSQSLFRCSSIGDTLPVISDRVTGNAFYFTLPNRAGTKYKAGDVINQAIKLYASDFSNCDSAGTVREKVYDVRIQPSPKIDDSIQRTVTVCGYYILPKITGTNLNNPKYFPYSFGGAGTLFGIDSLVSNKPNQIDTVVWRAFDSDASSTCTSEKFVTIIFKPAPKINKLPDVNLACGASFTLPTISGTGDLTNALYFTLSKRNGVTLPVGTKLDTSTAIYVNTFFDKCISEDTFQIKAPILPLIPKDLIKSDTFCTTLKLPTYRLPLNYNTRPDGAGINFPMGSDIIASYKLYVTVDSSGCKTVDSVSYTRKPIFIDPKPIDEPCSPVFNALPVITGVNLTGNQAFYAEKGGKGKKYVPGDTVMAFKRNYLYDSKILYMYDSTTYGTGKCVSEVPVIIPFFSIVEIDPVSDTMAQCSQGFKLPDRSNLGFFKPAIYTQPNKGGTLFPWGSSIVNPGTYYVYANFSKCFDEDTFKLLPPPPVIIPKSIFHNDSFCTNSFKLPAHPTLSVTYNTQRDGMGQTFNSNNEINNTTTLYLFIDSSGCIGKDSVTYIKKAIYIDTLPVLEPCSPVFKDLPVLTGVNLTGNQAYYASSNGQGKKYVPGDTLMSVLIDNLYQTRILYAFDSGYCKFERPYIIPFSTHVDLDQPKDTTILCHESFSLPKRGNWDFFKPDMYSLPNRQGDKYAWGQSISSSGTFYINYSINPVFSKCFDEDTFKLVIDSGPVYSGNTDLKECNTITLPEIKGSKFSKDSTFYFVQPLGQGARFKPGDVINSNLELFIYDVSQKCINTDTINLTISAPPNLDLKISQRGCDSLPLPTDDSVGTNIRYYLQPGAVGTFKLPGEYIKTTTPFYKYTGNAQCFSEKPFRLEIEPSPQINFIRDTTVCDEFRLPVIKGNLLSGTEHYHDDFFPKETTDLYPGTLITRSTRLVAFDWNSLGCINEKAFNITIKSRPDLSPLNKTIQSCDTLSLPSIASSSIKYYLNPDLTGNPFDPGTQITKSATYVVIGGDIGCQSQAIFNAEIFSTPVLLPQRDTTSCDEFVLPKILGKSLTSTERYYEMSNAQGKMWKGDGSEAITQSMTMYIRDSWGGPDQRLCADEDTFNITIIPRPILDTLFPVTECEQIVLPQILGANISNPLYYESAGGIGKSYKEGDIIRVSQKLYAYQASPVCPAEQPVQFTVRDSITSLFSINPEATCVGTPININHTGKKNNTTTYNWKISGPGRPSISNTPNQNLQLDTGQYKITLYAKGDGCIGDSISHIASVIKPLDETKNLNCAVTANSIVFQWDKTPGATDYQIDLLQGPFGVRSPQQMIFSNLSLGTRVGIKVTPIAEAPCANGKAASLTCVTRQCDPITVTIADEKPFCSGDGPKPLTVFSIGLNPADSNKITRVWSGPGIQNGLFYPSLAGPGDHIITYTLTKDSCLYMDTAVFKVGMGSLTILNTKPVECAPPSQRQFNINMQLNTPNKPVSIYYSFAGGRTSVYPFVSADRFTLSASFGLIGDSITIDSVLDANGCKMQLISNANTFTFKAVKFITKGDTTSVCDFSTKTYSYRVKINNLNSNDPLTILSGGGSIQDSFYLTGPIPFGTVRHVEISHSYACDTLKFDFAKECDCTPFRDTVSRTACALETVRINNKDYTFTNPSGIDTIPSAIIGLCDTIRFIDIRFIPDKVFNLNASICPDDVITVGTMIFDKNNLTGTVRLTGRASTACDSVVNVNLNLLSPVSRQVRDTLCSGESIVIDGITFNDTHTRDSVRYPNQASNGCDSVVYYTVLVENVQATISQESVGCSSSGGRSVIISNVRGGVGPYSYAFSTNPTSTLIGSLPLKLNNLPSDTFGLIIKSVNACTFTTNIAFNPINNGLKINLGSDRTIKLGDTVRINIAADFNLTSFKWITANYLSCTNCRNPIAQPLVSTLYIVEAVDDNGCVARDTLRIIVDPVVDVFVPNIFSPSSTIESNKELRIYPAPQITAINRIIIFDRWGNVYADLKNPPLSNSILVWDGKIKGQIAPQGVYSYKLTFTTADGKAQVKYGTITLIR